MNPPPPPRSSSSSSSSTSKFLSRWSPAPADLKKGRRKKQRPRNPLTDLNDVAISIASTNSSSQSLEAPRGCLRFLLSNSSSSSKTHLHRPKTVSKTPKSAPNARISEPCKSKAPRKNIPKHAVPEKLHKPKKNPPCLYQWQSRGPYKAKPNGNNLDKISSGSEVLKQKKGLVRGADEAGEPTEAILRGVADENSTPVSKLTPGSGLDFAFVKAVEENSNSSTNKTPPVQPSVSPEIQCGSALMATTPTCYGAGHIPSGVPDKRKCRVRGILTIGENHILSFDKFKALDNGDVQSGVGFVDNSRVSVVPLPTEASMHWLSSPHGEEDGDQKEDSENLCRRSAASPSSPSDMCNYSDNTTATIGSNSSAIRRIRKSLLSPIGLHEFQGLPWSLSDHMAGCSSLSPPLVTPCSKAQEEVKDRYSLVEESTSMSMRSDSLGTGNVIQTPHSDSSSDRHVGLSLLSTDGCKDQELEFELDSVASALQMTSFSPRGRTSMWDPSGFSSQFDQMPTPYNSIDLSQLQKTLERVSWISSSTLENVSHSQMRISWREGLISRIFQMDELDCCRCLSDEEEDAKCCSAEQFKCKLSPGLSVDVGKDHILTTGFGSPSLIDHKPGTDRKGKEKLPPQRPIACAESISTDGGDLVASGDSDWTLCYKNQLFEV